MGFFLTGVSWVYVSLSVFGGMPWWLAALAAFLFCAVMALFPLLAGWLFKRWQPAGPWRQALFFAALIAAVNWLRSWIFTGFPWLALGYSQAPPSPLAGFAPVLGVHGLSLLVALAGALLLRWRVGIAFLLFAALAGLALQQVAWTTPVGEPVRVALIQGNIPQEMKFRPEAFLRTLDLYRQLVEENPAQLTLLPETAVPAFFDPVAARVCRITEIGVAEAWRRPRLRDHNRLWRALLEQRGQPWQLANPELQQDPSGAVRRI